MAASTAYIFYFVVKKDTRRSKIPVGIRAE